MRYNANTLYNSLALQLLYVPVADAPRSALLYSHFSPFIFFDIQNNKNNFLTYIYMPSHADNKKISNFYGKLVNSNHYKNMNKKTNKKIYKMNKKIDMKLDKLDNKLITLFDYMMYSVKTPQSAP